jgi:hypothetical protein
MRDLALQASGALAIFVAIIHGAIAKLRERRERALTGRLEPTLSGHPNSRR